MWEDFGLKDAIDILLVAFLLYELYLLMKKTGATAILLGILSFVVLWLLASKVFEMRLLGGIMGQFINVGLILLVIVFQREVRDFLYNVGNNKGVQSMLKLLKPKKQNNNDETIMPIVMAVINMAKRKEGALIVMQQAMPLDAYIETGEQINANISTRLIENIFFKNSPLHDGAMIIAGKRIKSVACILPVSQRQDIPKSCGLRHRSALGLAEQSDAKIIIVSEETGKVSLAYQSQIYIGVSAEELQKMLTNT
ncbi:MAG: diadenylate cyclase CdaA [Candidatus Symbiothrix sp.]|nr:diadenylate cyclase CdaA [Candidatus Symbiothrix sp.]